MTDYNSMYNKLTKKELLYTLIARDVMLKDWRKRFELHKNTDAKTIQDQSDLIEELKAKLAEKEKEVENLNNRILISQLQAPKEQILNILSSQCIQYNPDQDKISFAVENLEKAKRHIIEDTVWELTCEDVLAIIDNQIKQLKEGK